MNTISAIAHSLATRPEQRARELVNIARAQSHVAMEDALQTYSRDVEAAVRQHAARLRCRAVSSSTSPVQAIHDREWASSLYWTATRRVNSGAGLAEAMYAAGGELQ